ncbi:hypothetical protein FKM82_018837 [Ascaphus truei]
MEHFPSLAKDGDLDTFLRGFEKTCRQHQLPRARWAAYLTPTLNERALNVVAYLPEHLDQDYEAIKAALLHRFNVTPETHRQKFRALQHEGPGGFSELVGRLTSLCKQWVGGLEVESFEGLLDLVVHEQFLTLCPPEVRKWVKDRDPKSAIEAGKLADSYVANRNPVTVHQGNGERVSERHIKQDYEAQGPSAEERESESVRGIYSKTARHRDSQPREERTKLGKRYTAGQRGTGTVRRGTREQGGERDIPQDSEAQGQAAEGRESEAERDISSKTAGHRDRPQREERARQREIYPARKSKTARHRDRPQREEGARWGERYTTGQRGTGTACTGKRERGWERYIYHKRKQGTGPGRRGKRERGGRRYIQQERARQWGTGTGRRGKRERGGGRYIQQERARQRGRGTQRKG